MSDTSKNVRVPPGVPFEVALKPRASERRTYPENEVEVERLREVRLLPSAFAMYSEGNAEGNAEGNDFGTALR
ncbi:hypothetical protein M0804_008283 [Polistes exclamans]|nr:hypothetical protein M0804_008283 [Polistes exclamans]